jgi:hypothetical protein
MERKKHWSKDWLACSHYGANFFMIGLLDKKECNGRSLMVSFLSESVESLLLLTMSGSLSALGPRRSSRNIRNTTSSPESNDDTEQQLFRPDVEDGSIELNEDEDEVEEEDDDVDVEEESDEENVEPEPDPRTRVSSLFRLW